MCLKSLKIPVWAARLPHHLRPVELTNRSITNHLPLTSVDMIFSAAVVVSVLSLFPFARAATLRAREGDCPFVCPDTDLAGTFLDKSFTGDTTISCSYVKESFNLCTYDSVSYSPLTSRDLAYAAP